MTVTNEVVNRMDIVNSMKHGRRSGFEIKIDILYILRRGEDDGRFRRIYHLSAVNGLTATQTKIHLQEMEKYGLVTSTENKEDKRGGLIYKITQKGKEVLSLVIDVAKEIPGLAILKQEEK